MSNALLRSIWSSTVLSGLTEAFSLGKCREKKSFKDFDCRAEEINRSVGVRFIGRFIRFKKRNNDGGLLDVRDSAGGH